MSETVVLITKAGRIKGNLMVLHHWIIRIDGREIFSDDDRTLVSAKDWERESWELHEARVALMRGSSS
jgi:hypothetical protein